MRLSYRKGDPGYRGPIRTRGINCEHVTITVNGKKVMWCHTADEELGMAWCYALDEGGKFFVDPSRPGHLAETIRKGKVCIDFPSRGGAGEAIAAAISRTS